MTVASMTGFARSEGGDAALLWSWEARSVNGKALDMRLRLPSGWERFDPIVRKAVQARFKRGNLSVNLDVRPVTGRSAVRINEDLLEALIDRCRAFGETPRLDQLLTVRGVVDTADGDDNPLDDEARLFAVESTLGETLDALVAARKEEGARIGAVLADHLSEIEGLVAAASTSADAAPDAIRARLAAQLEDLLPKDGALPSERLAQEAAVLAVKADVREELDRLRAHIAAARDLMKEGAGVGRRFDFLCQEFNREANTLASKSSAIELTRIGLDLKAVIDRLREQVQNLE